MYQGQAGLEQDTSAGLNLYKEDGLHDKGRYSKVNAFKLIIGIKSYLLFTQSQKRKSQQSQGKLFYWFL